MNKLFLLENRVQYYPWGSKEAIPDLLGVENTEGRPFAELWMGAHPKAPSTAITGGEQTPLNVLISRNPEFFLGPQAERAFGPRLPFLLKVLAAAEPLSIQAHPNLEQARHGFDEEERRGIPVDAPERNYRDANHKPELICALTPFSALCGFRSPAEIAEYLGPVKAAEPLLEVMPSGGSCRDMFLRLMFLTEHQKNRILAEVLQGAGRRDDEAGRWVLRLSEAYPSDIGIIAPYLLNLVQLLPGQALSLKAGVLHSYLHGTGVELMANSDNVLRGGLTAKHVDRDELLKVLDFSPLNPVILGETDHREHVVRYPSGADEFSLTAFRMEEPGRMDLPASRGPEILLCTRGAWTVDTGDDSCELGKGRSAFLAAAAGSYTLRGSGVLFRASVPVD